jgi:pilus assembly protein TadC
MILIATAVISNLLAERLMFKTDKRVTEAFGYGQRPREEGRSAMKRIYGKFAAIPRLSLILNRAVESAENKYAGAGYPPGKSPYGYLCTKYIMSFFIAVLSLILSGNLPGAVAVWFLLFKVPDVLIASKKRKNNMKLQKYIYKIYRFLSNQISSGVKVADAIKSVYTVADDAGIRAGLMEVAAKFLLTNDIELSMESFKRRYNTREVDSLKIALKQGIDTGGNAVMLERQEAYMFNRYFGYIQAETEKMKYRCFAAAMVFCLILCILFFIPIFMDLQNSINNILG